MIKISVTDDEVIISGHANHDDYGKDIVCASVSSIAITTVNAVIEFNPESIKVEEKEGYLKIDVIEHTRETDILISSMMDLLYELESKYPKNIKIN